MDEVFFFNKDVLEIWIIPNRVIHELSFCNRHRWNLPDSQIL